MREILNYAESKNYAAGLIDTTEEFMKKAVMDKIRLFGSDSKHKRR